MSSQCKKVKNPCKICLGNVTRKSGIQCEGACRSWVHYKCLNFTPGKISDIKRGLIIVSCPCPDCTTNLPKEIVKNEPYSCSNAFCPANMPPKCINTQCPSNAACPPPGHNSLLATPQKMGPHSQFGPCTVDNCKTTRISPTHRQPMSYNNNKNLSPSMSCCSGGDIRKAECVTQTKPMGPPPQCLPPTCLPPPCPPQPCPPPPCPPPPCPPQPCLPQPCLPQPCPPQPRPKYKYIERQVTKKNTAAIKAMERMCSTMGQLTCQLNTLMDKMQQALNTPQCAPACPPQHPPAPAYNMPQTNSCSLSNLPCCCPGGGTNDQQSMNSSRSMPPCLQDQQECSSYDSQPPCYCASNPLRRNDFY